MDILGYMKGGGEILNQPRTQGFLVSWSVEIVFADHTWKQNVLGTMFILNQKPVITLKIAGSSNLV